MTDKYSDNQKQDDSACNSCCSYQYSVLHHINPCQLLKLLTVAECVFKVRTVDI